MLCTAISQWGLKVKTNFEVGDAVRCTFGGQTFDGIVLFADMTGYVVCSKEHEHPGIYVEACECMPIPDEELFGLPSVGSRWRDDTGVFTVTEIRSDRVTRVYDDDKANHYKDEFWEWLEADTGWRSSLTRVQ